MSGPIVILTGAGISQESGLSTFRDREGIWSRVRLEDVATPEAFARNPDRVDAFYNARRAALLDAEVAPNAAHHALAELQQCYPGEVLLITQNIDDLHERAGSTAVLHMHGELLKARCGQCGAIQPWQGEMTRASRCGHCGVKGSLRVHVVWFGEMPLEMAQIYEALGRCETFIAIGTSGTVYPAAGFVQEALAAGCRRAVELNLEPSEVSRLFTETHYGPAGEIVPSFVEELLQGR